MPCTCQQIEYFTLVTENQGSFGDNSFRFLDFTYPLQVLQMISNTQQYIWHGYRISWNDSIADSNFYFVDFQFDAINMSDKLSLLGDNINLGEFIPITIINTNIPSMFPYIRSNSNYWCKVCSSRSNMTYSDTCWAILPSDDTNRDCGCNSNNWAGNGIYYGGFPSDECDTCSCTGGGGFAGYKANGDQKGGLESPGLSISMIFEVIPTGTSTQPGDGDNNGGGVAVQTWETASFVCFLFAFVCPFICLLVGCSYHSGKCGNNVNNVAGGDRPNYFSIFKMFWNIGDFYTDIIFSMVLFFSDHWLYYYCIGFTIIPHLLSNIIAIYFLNYWGNKNVFIQKYTDRYDYFIIVSLIAGFYCSIEVAKHRYFTQIYFHYK